MAPLAALLAAFGCAACSYPLGSMLSNSDGGAAITGSIGGSGQGAAAIAAKPSQTDLAYARAAAVELLNGGASENSMPWRNPQTGIGGNITPLAASYSEDGLVCREFLASYGRAGAQAWLRGSACRNGGAWQVKSLKPLKSS